MTDSDPSVEESARRIRAAMAYGKVERLDLAQTLNVSPSSLDRWTKGTTGQWRNVGWGDLWKIADKCGVPREWFSADFAHLYEIVPEGMPRFATPTQIEAGARFVDAARTAGRPQRAPRGQRPASKPAQDGRETRP